MFWQHYVPLLCQDKYLLSTEHPEALAKSLCYYDILEKVRKKRISYDHPRRLPKRHLV